LSFALNASGPERASLPTEQNISMLMARW